MKTYKKLYVKLCSYENLELAYRKARKRKTLKPYVLEFEKKLAENLLELRTELLLNAYRPMPIRTFILHDSKTRKIGVSDFRDRIVHHAICNVIEQIFDERFIYDSYANRKFKGVHAALKRFDSFKRKVTQNGRKAGNAQNNNKVVGFALKADIKHYFGTIDHNILLSVISKRIRDNRLMWLIRLIVDSYNTKIIGKGLPLGNLTSQFFANVYLNELDQFVKHELKARYYLRYVDDFVMVHSSKQHLEVCKIKIYNFLMQELKLELHPDKSKIFPLYKGVGLLGFRIFYHFKLLRKRNLNKMLRRLEHYGECYKKGLMTVEEIWESWRGWNGYAMAANTYRLRQEIKSRVVDFIIYEGKKKSRASTIIDLTKEKELIKER